MLDTANYTPRLRAAYDENIRASLKEEFGYKNDMQIPRLDKIVLNIGAGREAVKDSKKAKSAQADLTTIAGQHAVITSAKKSIAGFRVREGMPLVQKSRCAAHACMNFSIVSLRSLCHVSEIFAVFLAKALTEGATMPLGSKNTSFSPKSTLIKWTRCGGSTS